MITREERDRLRALADGVPMPGDDPEIIGRWWDSGDLALYPVSQWADRQFIMAASPDAVLSLLDALDAAEAERDRLAAAVERVRALHYAADNDASHTPACETCHGKAGVHECGCWAPRDRVPVCGHCNDGWHGVSVPWPCPTVRLLDEIDASAGVQR